MNKIFTTYYKSPLGLIEISGDENAVHSINFDKQSKSFQEKIPDVMQNCKQQLDEYFSGKRKTFSIQLNPLGTFFQVGVWSELQKINFGETISYLELSQRINNEKSIRAVGAANGKNPVAILIPCHRVLGANGKLVGYSGGLWRKQWLFEHEQKYAHGVMKLF